MSTVLYVSTGMGAIKIESRSSDLNVFGENCRLTAFINEFCATD